MWLHSPASHLDLKMKTLLVSLPRELVGERPMMMILAELLSSTMPMTSLSLQMNSARMSLTTTSHPPGIYTHWQKWHNFLIIFVAAFFDIPKQKNYWCFTYSIHLYFRLPLRTSVFPLIKDHHSAMATVVDRSTGSRMEKATLALAPNTSRLAFSAFCPTMAVRLGSLMLMSGSPLSLAGSLMWLE